MKAFSIALSTVFLVSGGLSASPKVNFHGDTKDAPNRAPAISPLEDFFLALEMRKAELTEMTQAHIYGASDAHDEIIEMLESRGFKTVWHDGGGGGGGGGAYKDFLYYSSVSGGGSGYRVFCPDITGMFSVDDVKVTKEMKREARESYEYWNGAYTPGSEYYFAGDAEDRLNPDDYTVKHRKDYGLDQFPLVNEDGKAYMSMEEALHREKVHVVRAKEREVYNEMQDNKECVRVGSNSDMVSLVIFDEEGAVSKETDRKETLTVEHYDPQFRSDTIWVDDFDGQPQKGLPGNWPLSDEYIAGRAGAPRVVPFVNDTKINDRGTYVNALEELHDVFNYGYRVVTESRLDDDATEEEWNAAYDKSKEPWENAEAEVIKTMNSDNPHPAVLGLSDTEKEVLKEVMTTDSWDTETPTTGNAESDRRVSEAGVKIYMELRGKFPNDSEFYLDASDEGRAKLESRQKEATIQRAKASGKLWPLPATRGRNL